MCGLRQPFQLPLFSVHVVGVVDVPPDDFGFESDHSHGPVPLHSLPGEPAEAGWGIYNQEVPSPGSWCCSSGLTLNRSWL